MKKNLLFLFVSVFICSCQNYDLLMIRVIQTYESKGAKIVSYSNPVTEEDHTILFEYNDALYYNHLEKQKGTPMLLDGNTRFKLLLYRPRIDNNSYQIALDTLKRDWQKLSDILGCSLHNAVFYQIRNNNSFLIQGH